MKVIVLISCMFQNDHSIIVKSNVQTDVVVVNQCDKDYIEEFNFKNKKGQMCHAKFISTTERGLSRSRNMAIRNAWNDICLICDDDEIFYDDYADKIVNAYSSYPNASVITFSLRRDKKKYPLNPSKISYWDIFRTSSVEITFKKDDVYSRNIFFDEKMGSGTGNGGGEENKFLHDIRKNNLEMRYEPATIATLYQNESIWFKGYTSIYFENLGWSTRRTIGFIPAFLYCIIWPITHKSLCVNSIFSVYKSLIKGFFKKL